MTNFLKMFWKKILGSGTEWKQYCLTKQSTPLSLMERSFEDEVLVWLVDKNLL